MNCGIWICWWKWDERGGAGGYLYRWDWHIFTSEHCVLYGKVIYNRGKWCSLLRYGAHLEFPDGIEVGEGKKGQGKGRWKNEHTLRFSEHHLQLVRPLNDLTTSLSKVVCSFRNPQFWGRKYMGGRGIDVDSVVGFGLYFFGSFQTSTLLFPYRVYLNFPQQNYLVGSPKKVACEFGNFMGFAVCGAFYFSLVWDPLWFKNCTKNQITCVSWHDTMVLWWRHNAIMMWRVSLVHP